MSNVTSTSTNKVTRPVRPERHQVVQQRLNVRGRRMLAHLNPLGWLAVDVSISAFAAILAFVVTPHQDIGDVSHVSPVLFACLFSAIVGVVAHIAALHDPRYSREVLPITGRVAGVIAISLSLLVLELALFHLIRIGRYIVFVSGMTSFLGMTMVRLIATQYSRSFAPSICFLGDDRFRFRATQFVHEMPRAFQVQDLPDVQDGKDLQLSDWTIHNEIDEVVFDIASHPSGLDEDLLNCLSEGIKVSSYSDFVESNYYLVPVEQIDAKWMFSARLDLAHPYYHGLKRIVDIVTATIGLILTIPAMIVSMILIRIDGPGPIFYSQIRLGRFNKPFRIYKLRTMVQDAERDGAQWAKTGDARITKIGKFLRKTRLDEIPQFWNVLKGDMSLVGPRPERPEFAEMLNEKIPFFMQRHLVKPGLTGWAQINYPYGASVEDSLNKLTYDLYYVKHSSFGLDMQILLRTVGAMMKGSR